MNLEASKLELVELILDIDNQQLIDSLIGLLKAQQQDFWHELSEYEKEEIMLGIRQLDAGQRIPLDDFLEKAS